MAGKKAEDLFIEDGEYKDPALRGAFESWLDQDWTYGPGAESTIPCSNRDNVKAVCFKDWDAWINRQVEDDWFKDVKNQYGNRHPREVFYQYWENNDDFRENVLSHVEWVGDASDGDESEGQEQDSESDSESGDGGDSGQSSFGASQFPQLHEVGVVNDNGSINRSKLRGLVVAFVGDIEEIKGESREFDLKWARHALLDWGKDKWGSEWIKFVAQNTSGNVIYDAVDWVYDNRESTASEMEKKFRGNFDIELGNPDTDDVVKAFLDTEVPGWDEEEEEEDEPTSESKWDKFEQESKEADNDYPDKEEQKESKEVDRDETDSGEREDDEEASPGTLGGWADKEGTTDNARPERKQSRNGDVRGRSDNSSKNGSTPSSKSTGGGTTDVECEDGGRPHKIKWPDVKPIPEFERNRVYEGNTFEWALKLPENSIDTMVTSPPYYALRDYDIEDAFPISGDFTCDHDWENEFCIKCGAFLGQLGHEPDPATFIEHIVDLMDRYKRVLKPTGSLWLNIGDTYAGNDIDGRVKAKRKSRMMIPERVYRRMVQTGWHLRDYVIWVKKIWLPDDDLKGNGKPFAGSSRLADQWEPMVRFTPEADHYSDVDSNRLKPPSFSGDLGTEGIEGKFREGEDTQRGKTYNELGTNPPDVWLINSDGYDGDHRAVFPEELPKRCINLTTPDRVCASCGRPYEKEVHVEDGNVLSPGGDYATYEKQCHCDAEHKPGVAFDPFLGSGTTGVAAANNGYDWAGVELSEKYQKLARERIPTGRQVGLDQW